MGISLSRENQTIIPYRKDILHKRPSQNKVTSELQVLSSWVNSPVWSLLILLNYTYHPNWSGKKTPLQTMHMFAQRTLMLIIHKEMLSHWFGLPYQEGIDWGLLLCQQIIQSKLNRTGITYCWISTAMISPWFDQSKHYSYGSFPLSFHCPLLGLMLLIPPLLLLYSLSQHFLSNRFYTYFCFTKDYLHGDVQVTARGGGGTHLH